MLKFVEKTINLPSVFRKPTVSDVFTTFDSFIPISYKHGSVKTS